MNNPIDYRGGSVVKTFRDRISYENELSVYRALSGSGPVPELRSAAPMRLELQQVTGETLSEWADRRLAGAGAQSADTVCAELARLCGGWFAAFQAAYHDAAGAYLIQDDPNPRNLLIDGSRVCGLDFEYIRRGSLTEAAASFTAMLLSMDLPGDAQTRLAELTVSEISGRCGLDCETLLSGARRVSADILQRRQAMKSIRQSTCAILAGGRGSRMGYADKSALQLGGYTFMEHILHTAQIFDRIVISANSPVSVPYPVIADNYTGIGPLGAIQAVLSACETDHAAVLACDTPLLTVRTVYQMYLSLTGDCDAVVACCSGRIYPVTAIYRRRVLPQIEKMIAAGDYRLRLLLDDIHTVYFDVDDERELFNVNTPEDLAELTLIYRGLRV